MQRGNLLPHCEHVTSLKQVILIRSHDAVSCDRAYQSFIMVPQLEQLILFDTTSRGECLITTRLAISSTSCKYACQKCTKITVHGKILAEEKIGEIDQS